MAFSIIIPARYASSRFPGKPLALLGGRPMLQHVYERACLSDAKRVIIATDDRRIEKVAREFGAEVCLTSPDHPSGTDRLQEVVQTLGMERDEVVVNVQGDEPLIPPALINQVAENLAARPEAGIATLSEPILSMDALMNPNFVKVVTDERGMALYFSRAPIPWPRDAFKGDTLPEILPEGYRWQRHIGMYAYRVSLLNDYVRWSAAPIERTESLEQLRALYHGVGIHVDQVAEAPPAGVDTPEDLARLENILQQN